MEVGLTAGWHDFFVAEAGASAALAGLLFVSVSINLEKILKYWHLPTRAIEALATLLCVLVVASWVLVPGQSAFALGLEVLGTGLVTWVVQSIGLVNTHGSGYDGWLRITFNQLPPLPYVIAGVLIAAGHPAGIYWLVPGTLLGILAGVYCAWILLVEIQR
jgi:hypothetical protein